MLGYAASTDSFCAKARRHTLEALYVSKLLRHTGHLSFIFPHFITQSKQKTWRHGTTTASLMSSQQILHNGSKKHVTLGSTNASEA